MSARDRDELKSFQRRGSKERIRERKNWRAYDATEFGQFDDEALALMLQEGRPPTSFNIIKRYVDTITGSILADGYDIHYETELGEDNDAAVLLKELYLEDKDLGNFQGEYLELVRAGFIYRGWLEMYVDRSRDPRGRVSIRYVPSDRITCDPDWTTHKVRDNKSIWTGGWMSPQQILTRFRKRTPEIMQAVALYESYRGDRNAGVELDKLFDRSPEFFDEQNGLYYVASRLHLEKRPHKMLFDLQTQQFLPDMDDEQADHILFAAKMNGQKIEVLDHEKTVCRVMTFCPGLSLELELEKGNHPIQTGGYPLFCFSSDCLNGRPNTPVDQLLDVQMTINKREASITHVLQTTSHNTLLVEEDATSDPEDAKLIASGRNRPGGGFLVAPGTNRESKIAYMKKNEPPRDLMDHNQTMYQIADRITPAVPALQGIGEEGDSGVLFQAKVAQAQVGIQIPSKFLKAFWHEVGDAYFYAAQQTYTYPMAFTSKRNKSRFALNTEGGIWMDQISRMRVTITQSPNSDTVRRKIVQQFVALNQYIPDPLTRQALARLMVKSLPDIPDEERELLAEIAKMSEELQRKTTQLQIFGVDQQLAQAMSQMQAQGLIAPVQGIPGAQALPPPAAAGQVAPSPMSAAPAPAV